MAKEKLGFQVLRKGRKFWYLHRVNGVSSWTLENAKIIATELHEDLGVPVRVRIKPTVEALWEKVLNRKKQVPQRGKIRKYAKRRGMSLTSGDRDYNTLAGVGRVSDHWDKVETSYADDFWHPDYSEMLAFADEISDGRFGPMKQVMVHDAGSGDHVHSAGYT